MEAEQKFSARSSGAQRGKMERTALLRAAEGSAAEADIATLPVGQVILVHSLFIQVEFEGAVRLCVVRKTLNKVRDMQIVVGDQVRFRETGRLHESGRPEAVIEQVLPRRTILTRTDTFLNTGQQPIVANAEQMLIVAALLLPSVSWGLIDRMIVAARSGGLEPIICLNKTDLATSQPKGPEALAFAREAMAHYKTMGSATLETSVLEDAGLAQLRQILAGKTTVLSGHSGVGKSSLIHAVQPALDLRTGDVNRYTGKGKHVTTSARRYQLDGGGYVIDTPGVKVFGLWGVTKENLMEFYPDVEAETAPPWRKESYERILASLQS